MKQGEAYLTLARTPSVTSKQVAEALRKGISIEELAQRWGRPQGNLGESPFLTPACAGYPSALKRLDVPPLRLFWQGLPPSHLPTSRVGIVGSRKATRYGLAMASDLGARLAARGVAVFSGLAVGIDSAAHQGALEQAESTGPPVAVLGHGWNHHYPRSNQSLRDQVLARGTLLTEYPPDHPPARWTFPERNRIIAAMVDHLVVVEAGPKSGSLYTAEFALNAGRSVWVVPNRPGYANSTGALHLLRDGAYPIIEVEDFLDQVSPALSGFQALAARQGLGQVGELQQALIVALLEGQASGTQLTQCLGCDAKTLAVQLGELELLGLVQRCGSGWELRPGQLLSQLVKEVLQERARVQPAPLGVAPQAL